MIKKEEQAHRGPRLFEPECRTPRQMQLANALCAYREMAIEVDAVEV